MPVCLLIFLLLFKLIVINLNYLDEYLKDKYNFHKFKVIYTKLLIYTLKINGRDAEFLQKFKEVYIGYLVLCFN